MSNQQKILILHNKSSGHSRLSFEAYLHELDTWNVSVETRVIGSDFDIPPLLHDIHHFDRIVVAGGDGTVSAVAGILRRTGKPIFVYPGGTANILAQNLGLSGNAKDLARVTVQGEPRLVDLGELEFFYRPSRLFRKFLKGQEAEKNTSRKIHFIIMAGTGFAAGLMSDAQGLKKKIGQAAYWISAFWNLFPYRGKFRIKMDGREVFTKGIGILILNFHKIQFDLKIVSECCADDGKFSVVIVKARSLFGLLPVLWSAVCERIGFKRWQIPEIMEIYQASEIEIESGVPMRLQFDGELLEKSAQFSARVLPGAAMLVYADSIHNHDQNEKLF